MDVMAEDLASDSYALRWRELDMQASPLHSFTLKSKPFLQPLWGFWQSSAPRWNAIGTLRPHEHPAIPAFLSHRSDARSNQRGVGRGTEPSMPEGGSSQAGGGTYRKDLPDYLRGWGFVTGDPNGKPVLFDMTQVLLIGVTPDGAKLQAREWGGGYTDEWVDYVAPADLKRMTVELLDKLQPLFARILAKQAGRTVDWITVTP